MSNCVSLNLWAKLWHKIEIHNLTFKTLYKRMQCLKIIVLKFSKFHENLQPFYSPFSFSLCSNKSLILNYFVDEIKKNFFKRIFNVSLTLSKHLTKKKKQIISLSIIFLYNENIWFFSFEIYNLKGF